MYIYICLSHQYLIFIHSYHLCYYYTLCNIILQILLCVLQIYKFPVKFPSHIIIYLLTVTSIPLTSFHWNSNGQLTAETASKNKNLKRIFKPELFIVTYTTVPGTA